MPPPPPSLVDLVRGGVEEKEVSKESLEARVPPPPPVGLVSDRIEKEKDSEKSLKAAQPDFLGKQVEKDHILEESRHGESPSGQRAGGAQSAASVVTPNDFFDDPASLKEGSFALPSGHLELPKLSIEDSELALELANKEIGEALNGVMDTGKEKGDPLEVFEQQPLSEGGQQGVFRVPDGYFDEEDVQGKQQLSSVESKQAGNMKTNEFRQVLFEGVDAVYSLDTEEQDKEDDISIKPINNLKKSS